MFIRAALSGDIAFIESLVPRLASDVIRPHYYTETQMIEGTTRHLGDAVARGAEDEIVIVVAEDDGRPLGFLWANTDTDYFTGEPHAYIEEIAVTSDGSGAGRALMQYAEDWARQRGYRYISLSVRPRNLRARSIYERRGYEVEVERMLKLL